jgi:hypothetical protein
MNPYALIARILGIALLMGALLAAHAWASLQEPQRARVLRQAGWLVVPGYVGVSIWVAVLCWGLLADGCDPLFGGFIRPPPWPEFPTSELPACSDSPVQARVKPELAAKYPELPTDWSQVYLRYDSVLTRAPDTSRVWLYTMATNTLLRVPRYRLEFRQRPPKRGIPWWRPQEASEVW